MEKGITMVPCQSNSDGNLDNTVSGPRVCMVLSAPSLSRFFGLLSAGFFVRVQAGNSINKLLHEQFDISESYIDDRIQTIFLNGRAVDDSNGAMIEDGDTLALSAAMPGMVGSTFRKGGTFAGMRSQISHVTDKAQAHDRDIEVKIKLFNLIAKELGPRFLEGGVWIQGRQWQDFLTDNLEYLNQKCRSVKLDEQDIAFGRLADMDLSGKKIYLSLKTS